MSPQAAGHLAMLLFSALVAGSFSLGALMANEIAPAAFNAVRFWIAFLIILGLVLMRGGVPGTALTAPWRYAVLGGLFGFYFVMMFEGLKTAPAISTAAVFTLTPILSGLFGWLLLRQVTSPRMALALAIGASGALWVIFRADLGALMAFEIGRGEVIYFVGCISHALYTPMIRLLNRGESPFVFTCGMLLAGSLMLTAYSWTDLMTTDWQALPMIVWITLGYTAVFASAASFLALQFGSLRLPSAKVMAYTYLTPSWVILWEIALGRPIPPALVLGGVGLTIVALLLLLRDETEKVSV